MTATINASTSSGVVITPDNSGNILLQYNGVAAPAFSAYANSSTSIPNNTATKVTFDVETFDTASCFSSNRFTPTVGGYYQVNAKVSFSANGTNSRWVSLFKNGSKVADIGWATGNGTNFAEVFGGYLIYCNGSSDYLEIYAYQNSGSTLTTSTDGGTYFQACLLRGA